MIGNKYQNLIVFCIITTIKVEHRKCLNAAVTIILFLLSFALFYSVLLGVTWFYLVLLGFYLVLLCVYLVLLCDYLVCTWCLLGFTWFVLGVTWFVVGST